MTTQDLFGPETEILKTLTPILQSRKITSMINVGARNGAFSQQILKIYGLKKRKRVINKISSSNKKQEKCHRSFSCESVSSRKKLFKKGDSLFCEKSQENDYEFAAPSEVKF